MTPAQLADAWTRHLVAPPAAGLEVCPLCHSSRALGYQMCWSCDQTARLPGTVERIVPITLWQKGSPAAVLMHRYKEPGSPRRREMTALLQRFLSIHLACLANGQGLHLVTHVPSRTNDGPHPLGGILADLFGDAHQTVLSRGPGAAQITRNTARTDGFIADPAVAGKTTLLVDDTFTTGATLQSAAIALTAAGARVHTALVIGRKVNPDFNTESRTLWDKAYTREFDWSRCCAADKPCRAAQPATPPIGRSSLP